MEFKRSMLILVMAIFIVSIAGVCASDANDTAISSENSLDMNQATDEIIGVEEDTNLASFEENEILSEGEKTFAQLNTTINGNTNNDVYLDRNYTYSSGDDSFKDGIIINRDVNIYGNGHTIDGGGQARIFKIVGGNVAFYNITFMNGHNHESYVGGHGGAIYGNCIAINCIFKGNSANDRGSSGGAMYGGSAVNCTFIGNHADTSDASGGAMYGGSAVNCTFIENYIEAYGGEGGAISHGYAMNCTFIKNYVHSRGGALHESSALNCIFTENYATGGYGTEGGAMYGGSAVNCTFNGNTVPTGYGINGSAMAHVCYVFTHGSDTDFYDCNPLTLHFDDKNLTIKNNGAIPINLMNQNNNLVGLINVGVNIYKEDVKVNSYSCLSGENLGLDLPEGNYTVELIVTYPGINQPEPTNITLTVSDGTTFTDLNKAINDNTNDTITLDNDYAFNSGFDSAFKEGIVINRQVTINGNGHTIDAKGKARVFNVQASDVTINNLTIKNANYDGDGGAIYFSQSGCVINCNFTNNNATRWGGAIFFDVNSNGNVINCNFTNNAAGYGGAIYFSSNGTVTNCNFTNNTASNRGGAIFFSNLGSTHTITNCNFTDNTAEYYGGAVYFYDGYGEVTNCNFINNAASNYFGGAIRMFLGTIENCNFTNNYAKYGGAVYFASSVTVSNSIFLNNRAHVDDNTPLSVTINENNIEIIFMGQNNLINAIYSINDVTFTNVTYWGANGITNTDDNYPSRSNKEAGQNITVKGVVNGNIINEIRVTDENGEIVLGAAGDYWIIVSHKGDSYYTEVAETLFTNMKFYVNVTETKTTNKTVNITAKSNIKHEVMPGKLLFILPNGTEINATYAADGIWWAVHTFDDYMDYQVNASYIGLSNVTLNNATISITKANSTLEVSDVVLDYGDSKNVIVTAEGAIGITAKINDANVTVVNNFAIQISGLAAGNYTLTVTTIADADHNPVTKNATITVNKLKTQLTADEVITTYNSNKDLVITLKGSAGKPLSGLNITVDFNGARNYTTDARGQVKISTKGLAAKIYEVMITFNGTENYMNSSKTTKVSIYKESSIVDTKPLTTVYNVHKYLVVGLKDHDKNPIRNADAYIEINGVTYKCRSDEKGNAKLIIRLKPNKYAAKITFDNVNYMGFTQYVTVIVKKATPKMTAKKKTFKAKKKVKKYTVKLKDNKGKALPKAKLTLKIKGKTFKAKTNAKGKAVFKIKKLTKKGTFKAKVKFAGNEYYKAVSKKVKIKIK